MIQNTVKTNGQCHGTLYKTHIENIFPRSAVKSKYNLMITIKDKQTSLYSVPSKCPRAISPVLAKISRRCFFKFRTEHYKLFLFQFV